MEKYKISLFDEKKLLKAYNSSEDILSINFFDYESLIFQITDLKENRFRLKYSFSEWELRNLFFKRVEIWDTKENELLNTKEYIDEFGETFTFDELQTRKYHYEQWQEIEDDKWNIITIKEENLPEVREFRFDTIKETWKDIKWKTYTTEEKTISDDDIDIILSLRAEKIFTKLEELWLKIEWYSWIIEPQKQSELAQGYYKEFNFIVSISDKEDFIQKSITIIEGKIETKGYTMEKLKENLLSEIKKLDEGYWTNWKEIYIKNKNKTDNFRYLLLLLHIEGSICIKEFWLKKDEFFVDLMEVSSIPLVNYLEKSIYDIVIKLNSRMELIIGDKIISVKEQDSNNRNWIFLFLTVLKYWDKKKMKDYLKLFEIIKQDYFSSIIKTKRIKDKTFADFPSRWNKFARDNEIRLYIQKWEFWDLEFSKIHPDGRNFSIF